MRILILCLLILNLIGCTEDDIAEVDDSLITTIKIDESYLEHNSAKWVVVSNPDGSLVGIEEISKVDTLEFKGAKSNKISITLYSKRQFGLQTWHELQTSQSIETGSNLILKIIVYSDNRPPFLGKSKLTVNNYTELAHPLDLISFSDGYAVNDPVSLSEVSIGANNFNVQLLPKGESANFLLTTFQNDLPVHRWVNNVVPFQDIVIDFGSFVNSPSILINRSNVTGTVFGSSGSGKGYILSNLNNRNASSSSNLSANARLGYLDGFPEYITTVFENGGSKSFQYFKKGDIPKSISIPSFDISVTSKDINSFTATCSQASKITNVQFENLQGNELIRWNVFAESGKVVRLPTLPEILKTEAGMSLMQNLTFSRVTFFQQDGNLTFDDLTAFRFEINGRLAPTTYENLSYSLSDQ